MADERAQPTRTERDDLLERKQEEITRLREELARAERDRDRWKRQSERLRQQLDAARRAGVGGRVGAPTPAMAAERDVRFPRTWT